MYQEEESLDDPVGVVPKEASEVQPPKSESISITQPSTIPIPEAKEQPKQSTTA